MDADEIARRRQMMLGASPTDHDREAATRKKEQRSAVKQLCLLFKVKYEQQIPTKYPGNIYGGKEFANMALLCREYGEGAVRKAILYYLSNWQAIEYIRGYPSIGALVGFRRQLFPESELGAPANSALRGQFAETAASNSSYENRWSQYQ